MQEDFNPEESIKYLSYFDANNLYGRAMSQYPPYGGFKFVKNPENLDIHNISNESDIGYIFEVNLDYLNTPVREIEKKAQRVVILSCRTSRTGMVEKKFTL